jgi:hypothetical protein
LPGVAPEFPDWRERPLVTVFVAASVDEWLAGVALHTPGNEVPKVVPVREIHA